MGARESAASPTQARACSCTTLLTELVALSSVQHHRITLWKIPNTVDINIRPRGHLNFVACALWDRNELRLSAMQTTAAGSFHSPRAESSLS